MKDFLKKAPRRANGTHGTLLLVIGAYFIYMAYKMYENTSTGVSSMSMRTTVILMAVMGIAGLLVMAYGGLILYFAKGKAGEEPEDEPEQQAEALSADPDEREDL